MATTPQQLEGAVGTTITTLYTAFVGGGASRGVLVSMDFANTTAADITVDFVFEEAGGTQRFIRDDLVVPAKGSASWRGMITLDTSLEKIRAIASATGVDYNGTVIENA